jgi:lipopolysaccharide export system permease protein
MSTFSEFSILLPQRELAFDLTLEEQAMSNAELLQGGTPAQLAELQWRISLVLLIPILVVFAVPLSRVSPREGRFARIVPAMLLYLVYFALLLAARDKVAEGELSPAIGLWWIHLVFAVFGWLLFTGRLPQLPTFGAARHA